MTFYLLADMFAGPDAAVIVSALIAAAAAVYKYSPQKSPSRTSIHTLRDELQKLRIDLTEIALKANTVWEFVFRRAASEAIITGVGTANSPLTITADAASKFDGLKADLQDWYSKASVSGNNERDILIWMEGRFGNRILEEVCLPLKLAYGACLLIAYAVATGNLVIEIPCDSIETPITTKPDNL